MVGTLEVLEEDKWLKSLLRTKPHRVGLSIYCWATASKGADGDELIEEIQSVRSVDIVDSPAAGGGVLSVLENAAKLEVNTPVVTIEQKESQMDEKQLAEKAALEKALSEKEIALAEATKVADLAKVEAAKVLEAVQAENVALKAEVATMKRKDLVEGFLTEKRAAGLKPAVESAIRRAIEGSAVLTRESLDKVHAEWAKIAEEIAKEMAPKAVVAELTAGLPPRTEAAVAPAPAPAAPAAKPAQNYAKSLVDMFIGVKA